ncbi:hypothetical protein Bra471DRAFT_04572 [Bradyrhizobium sp. WSM471]|nr:hypothetical protein Bra471DRAFT_04572 [Bradyrhizobium sp. WSM471]
MIGLLQFHVPPGGFHVQMMRRPPGTTHAKKDPAGLRRGVFVQQRLPQCARIASSSKATILVILIIGFTAGPAVSL